MRILKFVGAFVGTLLIVFLLTFGFNLDALVTLYENSEDLQEGQQWVPKTQSLKGLTEYIGEHPDRVSLTSIVINNPDSVITFRENIPRTMGTIGNFFLIATYARQVEAGELDPDEQISLEEVNRYQLPYIDQSNHQEALAGLRETGNITSSQKISLDNLVGASIRYNDLAIFDYLFFRFGPDAIRDTYQLLNIQQTDLILPFSGLFILINPHLYNENFDTHFTNIDNLNHQTFRDSVLNISRRYHKNERYHSRVSEVFEEREGIGISFRHRRDALALFPKFVTAELAELMHRLNKNELISTSVSVRIKDIMSWPMRVNNRMKTDLTEYGAIYDSRLGLVNGIDYGTSAYNGDQFAQAVAFDSLQVAFWFHMSSNLIHQDYMQRLMWDPALRASTYHQINKN